MVRWLHPAQFLRAGLDSALSAVIGARADARLIEAMVRPQPPFFDYSQESAKGDFWLDYTADTGDGWNSTYSIARLLALPRLEVSDPTGRRHVLERGRLLVLGGDEVYPSASREAYQERLVNPFEDAMGRARKEDDLHLYAIPGNHDWYDGLAAFLRLFCANRWVAGRRTRQSRSYFALKLPHNWWLLGTDVQLNNDIDVPQVEYFRQVAAQMGPDDRVILCNAEPAWLMAASQRHRGYLENNLEYLQEKVLGRRISLLLAGDLHHYQRHEGPEGRQKIVAGGGGAFLHPTHAPRVEVLRDGYVRRTVFPDDATSRRLAWRNLGFIGYSPLYGMMTGVMYLALALAGYTEVAHLGLSHLAEVVTAVLASVASRPLALLTGLAALMFFMGTADSYLGRWRTVWGGLHGLVHVAAAFFVGWGATHFITQVLGVCPSSDPATALCHDGWLHTVGKFGLASLLTFAGGFLVGPCITGVYLLVSLNLLGVHYNEGFASFASPDWKNFMRLRIDASGELTVYPIGVERVPRRWKASESGPYGPRWEPDDPRATEPLLIEEPVAVTPRRLQWQQEPQAPTSKGAEVVPPTAA